MNVERMLSSGINSPGRNARGCNCGGSSGTDCATGAGWSVTHDRSAVVKFDWRRGSGSWDFRAIYERWFHEVSQWIRAMGGPEADREDLVQDVFVVVHRRLPDFDGDNLPGWLYRIARNRVRDFRRLLWVKHLQFGSMPLSENLANDGPTPAETFETHQNSALLDRLLDRLTESERVALLLFEVDGYSGEEIAQILGIPVNTVWSRMHKGRKKLNGWARVTC